MTTRQAIWGMHLVALIWGSSAILGALITAPAQVITFGRCLFGALTLLGIFRLAPLQDLFSLSGKTIFLIAFCGVLIALYWILFFLTIKTSGVPLALATYASCSTLIAIGEVLFLSMSFRFSIIVASLLSALGVAMIHPVSDITQIFDLGLLYGMSAAVTISIMALILKHVLTLGVSAVTFCVNQLIVATIICIPFAYSTGVITISLHDLLYIALLGVVCTAFGQTFFNHCTKAVRMSSAAIIASMEVPYGVLLAVLILSQELTLSIVLGILLVTSGAVIVSVNRK